MRNLKRLLSLALAVIMVVGMMVMTTSAAESIDFGDAAEITNVEAVDVMVALGVLEGDDFGDYNPTDILTREQAAKIICYMLMGPANAEKLSKNQSIFVDVAAGRWSAGYIAYCANLGIISGYDGMFDPEGKLTGVAFGKMLLTALGYDAEVEGYVNDLHWATNIARDVIEAGIDDENGPALDEEVSRDVAAQMAYNTLLANTVAYSTKAEVNTGSANVTVSGGRYDITRNGTDFRGAIETGFDGYQQFCEKYFPKLTVDGTYDAMERPAHVWMLKKDVIGLYADTPDYAGYVTAKHFGQMSKVIDGFSKKLDESDADTYVNGIKTTTNSVARGNKVEIYLNAEDVTVIDRIIVTHQTVDKVIGKVTTVEAKDEVYVTIPGTPITGVLSEEVIGYEGLKPGTVILYHQDNEGVYYIQTPEYGTGTMTATTAGSGKESLDNPDTYTIDGDDYYRSGQTGTIAVADLIALKQDTTATYWLDNAAHIIWAEGEEAPVNLLMVLKNNKFTTGTVFEESTIESQVVFIDENGETKIVDISKIDGVKASTSNYPVQLDDTTVTLGTPSFVDNENIASIRLYKYEESKGSYALTTLTTEDGWKDVATASSIVKGIPSSFQTSYTDKFVTDSKTIYLVRDKGVTPADGAYKDSYTVYTGFANVPSMDIKANGSEAYVVRGVAKYMVINDYNFTGSNVKDDIYVLANDVTAHYNAQKKLDYFTVSAIVDGVKTTVQIADGATVQTTKGNEELNLTNNPIKDHTLYIINAYDADGFVKVMKEAVSSAPGTGNGTYYWVGLVGSDAAENDKVILGGTSYAYTDDCVVYTISSMRDIVTVGDITSLSDDTNDKISVAVVGDIYGTANNNTVKEIYVYKQDPKAPGSGNIGGTYGDYFEASYKTYATGFASLNVDVERPEWLDNGVALNYSFDMYIDNELYATITDTIAAASDNQTTTWDNSAGNMYLMAPIAQDAVITIKDFQFTNLAAQTYNVKVVDQNNKDLTIKTAPATTLAAAGATLTFQVDDGTDYSAGTFDWEIKGVVKSTATDVTLKGTDVAYNAAAQTTTANVKPAADYEDYIYVVINTSDLTEVAPTYSVTTSTAAALSTLKINGSDTLYTGDGDAELKVTTTATATAGIAADSTVGVTVALASTWANSNEYGLKVVVEFGGKDFTFIVENDGSTVTAAQNATITVNADVAAATVKSVTKLAAPEITGLTIKSPLSNAKLTYNATADWNDSITITFSEQVATAPTLAMTNGAGSTLDFDAGTLSDDKMSCTYKVKSGTASVADIEDTLTFTVFDAVDDGVNNINSTVYKIKNMTVTAP